MQMPSIHNVVVWIKFSAYVTLIGSALSPALPKNASRPRVELSCEIIDMPGGTTHEHLYFIEKTFCLIHISSVSSHIVLFHINSCFFFFFFFVVVVVSYLLVFGCDKTVAQEFSQSVVLPQN